ncbi:MAG: hypothetical protein EOP83_09315 [Verrucomicrobiaceae bacterium]|nr:MAG: hypothetical protein EOP83_09315 [Verrucomicrobiaceae bacterium]
MQHKTQLGGNKFIPKVRVFKPDGQTLAWFVFYVGLDPDPSSNPGTGEAQMQRSEHKVKNGFDVQITRRSADGKLIVRKHDFHLKL